MGVVSVVVVRDEKCGVYKYLLIGVLFMLLMVVVGGLLIVLLLVFGIDVYK